MSDEADDVDTEDDDREWVDDAPLTLERRGSVRLNPKNALPLTFSSVGDEFGNKEET